MFNPGASSHRPHSKGLPMTKILFLTSSPRGAASQSTRIGRQVVEQLTAAHPGAHVLERDLAANPLPHLDGTLLAGLFTPPDQLW